MPAGSGSAQYELPEPEPNGHSINTADLLFEACALNPLTPEAKTWADTWADMVYAGAVSITEARLILALPDAG